MISVPNTSRPIVVNGARNVMLVPNASVWVIDHAHTSASTVPSSTPSIATNADSITNAARTAAAWKPRARNTPTWRRRSRHGPDHDHPDTGDAHDEAEREVAAHQQEELLLLRHLGLHDVANRVGLPAVGQEATGERGGERSRIGHVEVRPVRHRALAVERRERGHPDEHTVVRDVVGRDSGNREHAVVPVTGSAVVTWSPILTLEFGGPPPLERNAFSTMARLASEITAR